ncbi:triosephosphate isomerase [Gracilibacillus halophilus YIM-C55.5]|uniref:Triosephosphate isomerase n=1 Tax=Gracilibacillus halophilus YIM-C55.5 TaxID=1308866 RepID=N4WJ25_9BACI|nr:triose-phosphate isomerase [Gracilibacillus halophilus]ENH96142.1 triosephosphate isomerase [Gracilibacillus halophilus YIM-C55.5]
MSNQKVLLGTNWKMTKTLSEGRQYVKQLREIEQQLSDQIELFIIPSFPHLYPLKEDVQGTSINIGAQNMHWEEKGAYTGEVSPVMLKELGLDLVEIGHSERRQYYNENDVDVNKKVVAALRHDLKALVCIGENATDKTMNVGKEKVRQQLKIALQHVPAEDVDNVIVAYEPVWAIGENGLPADADYVAEQHDEIRKLLVELYGNKGVETPILYGGSVNKRNFESYLNCQNVSGLFIGRAAWDIDSFRDILFTVNEHHL